jgi:drug/metabolite transporter (DMT)-like permease
MAAAERDRPRDNRVGAAWMVTAMAGFAVEDTFLKAAAQSMPVGQVMILFGLGGVVVFALWARLTGARVLTREAVGPVMRLRAVFEFAGRLFYTLALALTTLSATTAILQATPIVVVGAAALFLGEKVGWRRWLAIGIGMVGVLIVLRPLPGSFSLLSLLAVAGMLGFAGRDLASRVAPLSLSTPVLGVYGFAIVALAGAVFGLWEGRAFAWAPGALAAMAAAVGVGVFAYGALMRAMRTGDVSAVTPFRYTRLLFGVALGVLVFGEQLDGAMILGCAVIVGSGLFILSRSGKRG